ncbi:MAG: hypothetical protein R3E92_16750 [Burkholderiaceae bacterium]|nr:hypothetical protein [Rhodoferax sp.]
MADETVSREQQGFDKLRESIAQSIRGHHTAFDGWLYNGGTVLILFLTGAVAVLSGKVVPLDDSVKWLPAVLSAFAGLFVALERSLGFGPRWRFHTEMKAGYRTVSDMIDFYFIIPLEEKEQRTRIRNEIWQSLNALRSRESAIPNSGGSITEGG